MDMPDSLCQQSPDTNNDEGDRLVPTNLGCLWSMPEVCPSYEEAVGMERAEEAEMLEAARGMRGDTSKSTKFGGEKPVPSNKK